MGSIRTWCRDALAAVPAKVRGPGRRTSREPVDVVQAVHAAIRDAVAQGAASHHWFTRQVDVRVHEVDAVVGDADCPQRTWARCLVVTSPRAPAAGAVVALHRQAIEGEPCGPERRRFPVVLLAGRIGTEDLCRLLALSDAEAHLPKLRVSPDGRVVLDRRELEDGACIAPSGMPRRIAAEKGGSWTSRRPAIAAVARRGTGTPQQALDELDTVLRHVNRDPRVATLLMDWVSEAER